MKPLRATDVDCPNCGASPGLLCRESDGETVFIPHWARLVRRREIEYGTDTGDL